MRHRSIYRKLAVVLAVTALAALPLVVNAIRMAKQTTFEYGSITAHSTLTGLGNNDVKVTLDATGTPVVICTNFGGNSSPGQNPSKIDASGSVLIDGADITRNGTAAFSVKAEESPFVDAIAGGCPNNNWSAAVDFVFWETATIKVWDSSGANILTENFTCVTTRTGPDSGIINCTRIK